MFRALEKVRYVYVLHNGNTGFVTCHGNNKTQTTVESQLRKEIEEWRETLSLRREDDVLISYGFGLHFTEEGGLSLSGCEEFGYGTRTTGFLSQGSVLVDPPFCPHLAISLP
jgi:hypothetical protein